MNYCSNCGSNQVKWMVPAGDNRFRHVCLNCETIHYTNPKMVVGTLPIWEDKILLCRRAIEPRYGYWNLPAGYLENGETLEAGALRETREEAGIEVKLQRMHCIYNIPRINQVYCFFLVEMTSPKLDIGVETLEAMLFLPEEIPYQEMAFPSSAYAIKQYLAHKDTPFHGVHLGAYEG